MNERELSMTLSLRDIEREVSQLSLDDKTRLIGLLISSLEQEDEGDIEAAWEAEVLARSKEIREGRVTPVPADEALARVRRSLS
jgi:putative addiction module component (TIGR02574 family)